MQLQSTIWLKTNAGNRAGIVPVMSSTSDAALEPRRDAADAAASTEGADSSRRERILLTAIDQFAEKGFAAVRIDEIAAEADANKQLIYYYFGGKSGLYDSALGRLVELIAPAWAVIESASTFAEAIELYRQDSPLGVTWRRFVAWEGVELAARGGDIHLEEERTTAWAHLVHVVQKAQARGELTTDMDSAMFALLLTSFTGTPLVLPQVAQMITGADPSSEDIHRRQSIFLEGLLAALRP